MDRHLGFDPSLTALGWAYLEKKPDGYLHYIDGGTYGSGVKGKGKWNEKIKNQAFNAVRLADKYNPEVIVVEIPAFGSRGRNIASSVALVAVMELAWRIVHDIHCWRPSVRVVPMKPDTRKKITRAHLVKGVVRGWPEGAGADQADAAWLVARL